MNYTTSILIVNYNSSAFIENSLYALCKLTKNPFKVLIVDNNSKKTDYDRLKKIINKYRPEADIFLKREEHNLSGSMAHGTALNQLIKLVDTPYFSILDADATWLKKDWDEIFINRITSKIKIIGTQGIRKDQLDFPIMFAVFFETKTFRELNIDFRPTNILSGQDTGWEMKEKYLKMNYRSINLEFRSTRKHKEGPFKSILGVGEYYLGNDIFATHFGRGSNPFSKKIIKTKNRLINLIMMPINYLFWVKKKERWIMICKNIVKKQEIRNF